MINLFYSIYKISFSSFDLKNLFKFFYSLNCNKNILTFNIVFLPKKIVKFCVLRSPFVHKDSCEQYEICKYKVILLFKGKRNLKEFLLFFNKIGFLNKFQGNYLKISKILK